MLSKFVWVRFIAWDMITQYCLRLVKNLSCRHAGTTSLDGGIGYITTLLRWIHLRDCLASLVIWLWFWLLLSLIRLLFWLVWNLPCCVTNFCLVFQTNSLLEKVSFRSFWFFSLWIFNQLPSMLFSVLFELLLPLVLTTLFLINLILYEFIERKADLIRQ